MIVRSRLAQSGRCHRYIVTSRDMDFENDRWISGSPGELENNEVLDTHWKNNPDQFPPPN